MTENTNQALTLLKEYQNKLQCILNDFTRNHSGVNIGEGDSAKLGQIVIELRDLLNDLIGDNTYSTMIINAYNEGISNFYESPSYNSVEKIISVVASAITRIERNSEILKTNKKDKKEETNMPLTHPDKVTVKWLMNHVHISFWFWSAGLLISSFLLGVASTTKLSIVQEWVGISCKNISKNINRESNKTALTTEKEKNTFPSLRVKFLDGTIGNVSITYYVRFTPSEVPRVFASYASQEEAIKDIHSSIKSAIYSILETKTIDYVRNNRDKLSSNIITKTMKTQLRSGHEILSLSILEISEIKNG